jgi:hypothetical protein
VAVSRAALRTRAGTATAAAFDGLYCSDATFEAAPTATVTKKDYHTEFVHIFSPSARRRHGSSAITNADRCHPLKFIGPSHNVRLPAVAAIFLTILQVRKSLLILSGQSYRGYLARSNVSSDVNSGKCWEFRKCFIFEYY